MHAPTLSCVVPRYHPGCEVRSRVPRSAVAAPLALLAGRLVSYRVDRPAGAFGRTRGSLQPSTRATAPQSTAFGERYEHCDLPDHEPPGARPVHPDAGPCCHARQPGFTTHVADPDTTTHDLARPGLGDSSHLDPEDTDATTVHVPLLIVGRGVRPMAGPSGVLPTMTHATSSGTFPPPARPHESPSRQQPGGPPMRARGMTAGRLSRD